MDPPADLPKKDNKQINKNFIIMGCYDEAHQHHSL